MLVERSLEASLSLHIQILVLCRARLLDKIEAVAAGNIERGIKPLTEHNTSDWHIAFKSKRNVRTKCSMKAFLAHFGPGNSISKRDVDLASDLKSGLRGELTDRTMVLPGNDLTSFYDEEFTSWNFIPIVWEDSQTSDGFCTALFEPIGGATAKSFGVRELCGCTVLIIASRTGVYLAHYFEDIVFDPDDDFLKGTTEEALFNNYVIKGLINGVPKPPGAPRLAPPRQVSLTANARTLMAGAGPENKFLKAYLIHPTQPSDDDPATLACYVDKWARIRRTVGEILPPLKVPDGQTTSPGWTDLTYIALDHDDRLLVESPAGKVIFKYDPDHDGKKKTALWIENDPTDRHDDQWT